MFITMNFDNLTIEIIPIYFILTELDSVHIRVMRNPHLLCSMEIINFERNNQEQLLNQGNCFTLLCDSENKIYKKNRLSTYFFQGITLNYTGNNLLPLIVW